MMIYFELTLFYPSTLLPIGGMNRSGSMFNLNQMNNIKGRCTLKAVEPCNISLLQIFGTHDKLHNDD